MGRVYPSPHASPTQAALYCRVSTPSQEDNYSLLSQLQACRDYAQTQGYLVSESHVYQDVASGFSLDRPALSQLRDALRRGEIQAVIVNTYDRWSSENAGLYRLYSDLQAADASLESVSQGVFQDTAIGRAVVSMYTTGRELWLEDHKERTQRGLKERIKAGKPLAGGKPIYGYHWRDAEKSGLDIYEPEAQVVRRIFKTLAGGGSAIQAARELNDEGVPSPMGSVWGCSTIGRMVRNDAYVGKAYARKWDCEKVRNKQGKLYIGQVLKPEAERMALPEGTFPALVDQETAAKALAILVTNRERIAKVAKAPEDFLLRGGIIRCAVCGHAMTGAHSEGRILYRCQATYREYRKVPKHRSPQIAQGLIDGEVWEHVLMVRANRDYVRQHIEQMAADTSVTDELDSLEATLKGLSNQEANLSRAIAMVTDADTMAPLVAQLGTVAKTKRALQEEREVLLTQAAILERTQKAMASFESRVDQDIESLDQLSYQAKRDILESLGVSVKVWPTGTDDQGQPWPGRYDIEMAYDISAWLEEAQLAEEPNLIALDEARLVGHPVLRAGTSGR